MTAGIAQPVEHKLPKLGVAGSKPVARSMNFKPGLIPFLRLPAVEMCGAVGRLRNADLLLVVAHEWSLMN